MTTAFATVLSKLTGVTGTGNNRKAKCPAHDDNVASLSVTDSDDRVVLHCHAGCEPEAVVSAMGLTFADLFPSKEEPLQILNTYDYRALDGTLLYQSARFFPKEFRQRRPDGNGGWIWDMATLKGKHVPYRLPELKGHNLIFVVEGEKDADRLWSLGLPATTNIGGAKKWTAADAEALRSAGAERVVIFPDNDKAGSEHAKVVASRVKAVGLAANIIELPGLPARGDVSDWLDAGHTKDELLGLIDAASSAPDAPATLATPPEPSDHESPSSLPLSQATLLLRLAQETGAECFHDDEQSYVYVPVDDHHEIYAIRSRRGRAWLQGLFMDAMDKCPGSQAIADATNALEALALRGPAHRVHVRIAAYANRVYLDLADASWRVIEISATGWRLVCDPPVRFRRPKALLPLPLPLPGGSLSALRPFVNVSSDDDFVLVAAMLVATLRGQGPYPLLVENGEQGAGKSTLTRILKALIDPNRAPLRSSPRDPRDLMIAATNNHLLAFDNLSDLPAWLSDALCRLSTGGGFSTRTLYTDRDEEIFDAVRPVIVNGIPEFANRQDLVGRALFVALPPIPDKHRRDESAYWAQFESARPEILGALLDIVAVALRDVDTVMLDRPPRMADFAKWMAAAEPVCPWLAGTFMRAYEGNRSQAVEATLDGDPIADLVKVLAKASWVGTAKELLDELTRRTPEASHRQKDWPTKPRQVGDAVRRLAPALRQIGIDVTFKRQASRRLIELSQSTSPDTECLISSSSSASSPTPENRAVLDDEGCDEGHVAFVIAKPSVSGGNDARDADDAARPVDSGPATLPEDEATREQI
jgi:hypothetical protein